MGSKQSSSKAEAEADPALSVPMDVKAKPTSTVLKISSSDSKSDGAGAGAGESKIDDLPLRALYREVMKTHLVAHMPQFALAGHKYANGVEFAATAATKELRKMKGLLPVDFDGTILVRFNKSKPGMIQALIIGAEGTPYESGCFVFDVALGSEYPEKMPQAWLMTTGGGQVRFNPNLYNCGKVCLSLLGTWAGPGWTKDSSLLQVLVSIQSLVMTPRPYFNEPGRGAPTGKEASDIPLRSERKCEWTTRNGGYDFIRAGTVQYAITDQIIHPAPGFEDAILDHFYLKRDAIKATLAQWSIDAEEAVNKSAFRASIEAAIVALDGIEPRSFSKKVITAVKKVSAAGTRTEATPVATAVGGGGGGGGGAGAPVTGAGGIAGLDGWTPAKPVPLASVAFAKKKAAEAKAAEGAAVLPKPKPAPAPPAPAPAPAPALAPAVAKAPKGPPGPSKLEVWKKDQLKAQKDKEAKVAAAQALRKKRLEKKAQFKALQHAKKLELQKLAAIKEAEKALGAFKKSKEALKAAEAAKVAAVAAAAAVAEPKPATVAEPKPVPVAEPKPAAVAEPKPAAVAEPKPAPKPAAPKPAAPKPVATKGPESVPTGWTKVTNKKVKGKKKRGPKKGASAPKVPEVEALAASVWATVGPRRAPRKMPRLVRRSSDE